MSNDKKKFQKLSDDSVEKAAGGALHVEQEKGALNLYGLIKRYHVWEDGQDGKETFDVRNLDAKQARDLIGKKGYDLKGKDPFTGEE